MCAMLVLIAPEELRISKRRVTRFVDAYIGLSDSFGMCLVSLIILVFFRTLDEAPTPCECGLFAQILSSRRHQSSYAGMNSH
jgi:hypothetical protein